MLVQLCIKFNHSVFSRSDSQSFEGICCHALFPARKYVRTVCVSRKASGGDSCLTVGCKQPQSCIKVVSQVLNQRFEGTSVRLK